MMRFFLIFGLFLQLLFSSYPIFAAQGNTISFYDFKHTPQPSAPRTGYMRLYFLSDGIPYFLNATGSAYGLLSSLQGDVTTSGYGSPTATIAASAVSNSKMANMIEATVKGRASGAGTGAPTDLTATQATSLMNTMIGDSGSGGTKGLVGAPAAGDAAAAKFWKADGTWAVPAGSGGATAWASYTPTFSAGFGTVTCSTCMWYRETGADTIEIEGWFTLGTPAGSVMTMTLPSGYTSVSTYKSAGEHVGQAISNAATVYQGQILIKPSDTKVYFGMTGSAVFAPNTERNGTDAYGAGQELHIHARLRAAN